MWLRIKRFVVKIVCKINVFSNCKIVKDRDRDRVIDKEE